MKHQSIITAAAIFSIPISVDAADVMQMDVRGIKLGDHVSEVHDRFPAMIKGDQYHIYGTYKANVPGDSVKEGMSKGIFLHFTWDGILWHFEERQKLDIDSKADCADIAGYVIEKYGEPFENSIHPSRNLREIGTEGWFKFGYYSRNESGGLQNNAKLRISGNCNLNGEPLLYTYLSNETLNQEASERAERDQAAKEAAAYDQDRDRTPPSRPGL